MPERNNYSEEIIMRFVILITDYLFRSDGSVKSILQLLLINFYIVNFKDMFLHRRCFIINYYRSIEFPTFILSPWLGFKFNRLGPGFLGREEGVYRVKLMKC